MTKNRVDQQGEIEGIDVTDAMLHVGSMVLGEELSTIHRHPGGWGENAVRKIYRAMETARCLELQLTTQE